VRRARLERYDKSLLDSVLEDARLMQTNLGATDRRKVDEYLYAIREIETRIQKTEREKVQIVPAIDAPSPSVPENFTEHTHLMFDLITVAFQTDVTRVVTLMLAIEQSNRAYREIGIPDSHHGLTHHGGDKDKIEKCIQINRYQMEQFAYFIGKLKATQDGDGTLFDHAMVSYGSGLSLYHENDILPPVLTCGGNGLFKLGRHIKYPTDTPLANLHLSMIATLGLEGESFADGTGRLKSL